MEKIKELLALAEENTNHLNDKEGLVKALLEFYDDDDDREALVERMDVAMLAMCGMRGIGWKEWQVARGTFVNFSECDRDFVALYSEFLDCISVPFASDEDDDDDNDNEGCCCGCGCGCGDKDD